MRAPSASSVVATLAGIAGLLGVLSQVFAYAAARSYYLTFGVEPSAIGITPLNSAFSLSYTWIAVYGELLGVLLPLGFIIICAVALRSLARLIREQERMARARKLAYSRLQRCTGGEKWQAYERAYARERRTIDQLARSRISDVWHVPIRVAIAFAVLVSVSLAFVYATNIYTAAIDAGEAKARALTGSGQDKPSTALNQAVSLDLSSPTITFKWIGLNERRPLALSSGSQYYVANLIGTTNGQHVLFLRNEITSDNPPQVRRIESFSVILVSTSDVAISGLGIRS